MTSILYRQPAFVNSSFQCFHDELIAYLTFFCEPKDLLVLSQVNSVFYIFCQEEPLWMSHCIKKHNGKFHFQQTWKKTYFFPIVNCPKQFQTLGLQANFASDFLYRRWLRRHMDLKHFVLQGEKAKVLKKIDTKQLTFQSFYEEYARIPFIMINGITEWKATKEWTREKMIERFGEISLRITHNLESSQQESMGMTLSEYFHYMTNQKDETPLYIFDPRFGEKIPQLLKEYDVNTLQIFQQDFLQHLTQEETDTTNTNPTTTSTTTFETASSRPDFRWLVVGPERSGAPWHTDPACTSAWNALLKGRKRWALYPPDHPPPGIIPGTFVEGTKKKKKKRNASDSYSSMMNMTSLTWYLTVYPTLKEEEKPFEIIQEEGEVIYVPSGWWHLVLNLEETIAVTQNFIDGHNLLAFLNDLQQEEEEEEEKKKNVQVFDKLQNQLVQSNPSTSGCFDLFLLPKVHGFCTQEIFFKYVLMRNSPLSTFYWKNEMFFHRFFQKKLQKIVLNSQQQQQQQQQQQRVNFHIKNVTSRHGTGVNPCFVLTLKSGYEQKQIVVKFFSCLSENRWGELDLIEFMNPFRVNNTVTIEEQEEPLKKKQQRCYSSGDTTNKASKNTENFERKIEKNRIEMRHVLEESFSNEVFTYQELAKQLMVTQDKNHEEIVPGFYGSGYLYGPYEQDDEDKEEDKDDYNGFERRRARFWRWPYILIEYKKTCTSLSNVLRGMNTNTMKQKQGLRLESWFQLCQWLGNIFFPFFHTNFKIPEETRGLLNGVSKAKWAWYVQYLTQQRQKSIGFLMKQQEIIPYVLLTDLERFLPLGNQESIQEQMLPSFSSSNNNNGSSNPVWLHGDLTEENIMGKIVTTVVKEDDVEMFLKKNGCEQNYIDLLVHKEQVKSMESLFLIKENHLKELEIPLGPRLLILKAIKEAQRQQEEEESEDEWEEAAHFDSDSSDDEEEEEEEEEEDTLCQRRRQRFLGEIVWKPECVIDFADTKSGDPLYDLVAVFFAGLHGDPLLWKQLIATNYWQEYLKKEQNFLRPTQKLRIVIRERLLKIALVHPSYCIKGMFHFCPQIKHANTWNQVAEMVFGDLFTIN